MAKECRCFIEVFFEPHFFDDKKRSVKKPPDYELPVGAMPETGEEPHNKNVEKEAGLADSVAAKGNIDVITEPASKGHMPPAPKFGDAFGNIGEIEVFEEFEAKDASESYGHIGIARKIEINLEHERRRIYPVKKHGLFAAFAEDGAKFAEGIGKKHLFSKTQTEALNAVCNFFEGMGAAFKHFRNIHITDYRPGNKLGEKHNIGSEIKNIFICLSVAAVNINGIACYLEGIKAYSHRKGNLQQRNRKPRCRIEVRDKEIRIFEIGKEGKAYYNGNYHEDFSCLLGFCLFHQKRKSPRKGYGSRH